MVATVSIDTARKKTSVFGTFVLVHYYPITF